MTQGTDGNGLGQSGIVIRVVYAVIAAICIPMTFVLVIERMAALDPLDQFVRTALATGFSLIGFTAVRRLYKEWD